MHIQESGELMELMLLVYAIGLLSKLYAAMGILILVFGVSTVILFISLTVESPTDYDRKYFKESVELYNKVKPIRVKYIKRLLLVITVAFTLMTVLPSEKTAYVMVAAYAAQKVATHPGTEEISAKVLKIINQNLDKYVDAK